MKLDESLKSSFLLKICCCSGVSTCDEPIPADSCSAVTVEIWFHVIGFMAGRKIVMKLPHPLTEKEFASVTLPLFPPTFIFVTGIRHFVSVATSYSFLFWWVPHLLVSVIQLY